VAKSKKKTPLRRSALVFRDVTFFEDPCEDFTVLYALAGGVGIEGIKAPTVIMGPADIVKQIVAKLRER